MYCFCNTIEKVKELVDFLQYKEFEVGGIHSELTQPERTQLLKDFDFGHSNVFIATSWLEYYWRGLGLNYELTTDINDYIQSIGRTGRVGVVGETLSFYDEDVDADLAKDLVTALKSGNQTVPEFLSTACAGDVNEKEFEMSEEVLYFRRRKLNVKRPLDTFEEEDAW
ncbi:ATP-dependent RNA helicase vasa, isoform A [Orchesella cincta]|uniref:ATP-dependent RNA helicase vasa, isoform A n=1 Tax=Orchesella cincta TaxID=48709 RepID=A0A1D2NJV5_ORCCI|nr:ATP-dependent RNA helicase vasa, isoform A [Orchesella cincta]